MTLLFTVHLGVASSKLYLEVHQRADLHCAVQVLRLRIRRETLWLAFLLRYI